VDNTVCCLIERRQILKKADVIPGQVQTILDLDVCYVLDTKVKL